MKSNREHRVLLSDQSIDILEKARMLWDKSGLVFPSPMMHGKSLHNATMMQLLQRAQILLLADRRGITDQAIAAALSERSRPG